VIEKRNRFDVSCRAFALKSIDTISFGRPSPASSKADNILGSLSAGRLIAFPNPLEGFGHCLKLHSLIDVARGLGKDELVRISFGLQHF